MPLPASYFGHGGVSIRGINRTLSAIYHQSWSSVAAKDADGYVAALLGPNTATFTLTPVSGMDGALVDTTLKRCVLTYARNVIVTVTHGSSIVALSGVITGTDAYGRLMTEAWAVTATGTSKTSVGKKAFKTITSITIVAAADATGDTVIVGEGDVLGLDLKCSVASALKEIAGGSVVTNGVVVNGDTTDATKDPIGTYAPNSAPAATAYELVYVSDNPAGS